MNQLLASTPLPISDWPKDIIPKGAEIVVQSNEDGTYILKGFFIPESGVLHIQEEYIHNERP